MDQILGREALEFATVYAVSYTHLDVYKRQLFGSTTVNVAAWMRRLLDHYYCYLNVTSYNRFTQIVDAKYSLTKTADNTCSRVERTNLFGIVCPVSITSDYRVLYVARKLFEYAVIECVT